MERKTFLKSSLAVAAAAIPGMGTALPRALASDALKKKVTLTWWGWGDPPVHRNVTSSAAVSHNSPNDAVKVFYEKSHPGVVIDTYDDHRIAMSFSLAALGGVPVTINDPDCVSKTFPGYFKAFGSIAR